ncbi:hypothetical protein OAB44_00570 [Pelagibacteraceae bacterium]|nr:hypothetical protein [Pelagibacteraceae bacterium]
MKKNKEKNNKAKENNIVHFKKNAQTSSTKINAVSEREAEINGTNEHCRKIFTELDEFADSRRISVGEVWYRILFFAKQRAIQSASYHAFKIIDVTSTKEVTSNYAEVLNERFPELTVENKTKKLH